MQRTLTSSDYQGRYPIMSVLVRIRFEVQEHAGELVVPDIDSLETMPGFKAARYSW